MGLSYTISEFCVGVSDPSGGDLQSRMTKIQSLQRTSVADLGFTEVVLGFPKVQLSVDENENS